MLRDAPQRRRARRVATCRAVREQPRKEPIRTRRRRIVGGRRAAATSKPLRSADPKFYGYFVEAEGVKAAAPTRRRFHFCLLV